VASAKLQVQFAKAKEADGRWGEAATAYEAAGEGGGWYPLGVCALNHVPHDTCILMQAQEQCVELFPGAFLEAPMQQVLLYAVVCVSSDQSIGCLSLSQLYSSMQVY
jgi:hypothetical protein